MGRKITVDSATLANKGLELIEAHWLFGIPYDRIEVVVHPTSVVHSLVRFRDGALLAHLGRPDMRVPISFALTYPERAAVPAEPVDLAAGLDLHFEAPDAESFPLLPLAREAGERGGTYPCAYNAANEVAVAAFLQRRRARGRSGPEPAPRRRPDRRRDGAECCVWPGGGPRADRRRGAVHLAVPRRPGQGDCLRPRGIIRLGGK